jgi:adenine/guanine phosphoribosyltransferase-like PRPP-binding protein
MSYLDQFTDPNKMREIMERAKQVLPLDNFDAIAVRGNSGLLIGAPLAMTLDKKLLIIRKNGEKNHDFGIIVGWGKRQKIMLVDDFIDSGATLYEMIQQIGRRCDSPEIVGIFLYNWNEKMWKGIRPFNESYQYLPIYAGRDYDNI